MNYLLLVAFWVLYFSLHSLLASLRSKAFFERILGKAFRFYRIIYSFFSTVGLLLLLFINSTTASPLLFESIGLVRYLSLMLATFGVIIISRTFKEYRFLTFIGLKQEGNEFKRTGILKYVRHPIYSGTILIVIGFFLFSPTLATLVSVSCIMAYLPFGIYLEERKLINQFGDQYVSYRKEVPSIFPGIK